jgi:hypothetical protein
MANINSVNNRFLNQPVTTTATSYTALASDVIIEVTNTSVVRTITLPAPVATGNVGKAFLIKDTSGGASTNNISIVPASGLIDGQVSASISSNYGSLQIFCDGSNYYSYGGSSASSSSSALSIVERVFTASGTYTPTIGMVFCEVQIVGGGGAGGGAPNPAATQFSAGAGGGSGEYAFGLFSASQIGASQSITIGAGGTGVSAGAGNSGGTTSFGSLMTALGGSGGATTGSQTAFNGGGTLGGTGGTGGNYRIAGGSGGGATVGVGATSNILFGGYGGNSKLGSGGIAGAGNGGRDGTAGLGYGSGGGGAVALNANQIGGNGSSGVVIIQEYVSQSAANLPVVALATASWAQYNGVIGLSGQSSPDSATSSATPFASSSRINFAPLTTNYSSGLTAGTNNVTINQSGTYRIVSIMGMNSAAGNSACTQIVKNNTTVLAFGVQDCTATNPFFTTVVSEAIVPLSTNDIIDFRWSSGLSLLSLEFSIQQLPSSTIVPITTWNAVAGTAQVLVPNSSYYTQNSSLTTLTLPVSCNVGTIMQIAGVGSGGWILAQNASQSINFGNQVTTTGTGGSIASTNRYDGIQVLCVVANTQWVVLNAVGNLTVT